MNSKKVEIHGVLVALGTPAGEEQPRALVHCTADDIAQVSENYLGQRVMIVPLRERDGSILPPVVAECERLRAENRAMQQAVELAERDAGLYCATLQKAAYLLGCDTHLVDHAVEELLKGIGDRI